METEMLKRASRRSIADFIMCGSESLCPDEGTYDEKLRKYESAFSKCLDDLKLSEREKDLVFGKECDLTSLYFEEGLKIGALLMKELTA